MGEMKHTDPVEASEDALRRLTEAMYPLPPGWRWTWRVGNWIPPRFLMDGGPDARACAGGYSSRRHPSPRGARRRWVVEKKCDCRISGGTRRLVAVVLDRLAAGEPVRQVAADYPDEYGYPLDLSAWTRAIRAARKAPPARGRR